MIGYGLSRVKQPLLASFLSPVMHFKNFSPSNPFTSPILKQSYPVLALLPVDITLRSQQFTFHNFQCIYW
jgi:hypothetical protein